MAEGEGDPELGVEVDRPPPLPREAAPDPLPRGEAEGEEAGRADEREEEPLIRQDECPSGADPVAPPDGGRDDEGDVDDDEPQGPGADELVGGDEGVLADRALDEGALEMRRNSTRTR